MGLDMYLNYKCKINNRWEENEFSMAPSFGCLANEKLEEKDFIIHLAYWRKSNQIHYWFVNNVQNGNDDCGEYEVSVKKLLELRSVCEDIVEKANEFGFTLLKKNQKAESDMALPEELVHFCESRLPVQNGFFFGSTEYDFWYLADIKCTLNQICGAFELLENNYQCDYASNKHIGTITYQASW